MNEQERKKLAELEKRVEILVGQHSSIVAALESLTKAISEEHEQSDLVKMRREAEETLYKRYKTKKNVGISFNRPIYDADENIADILCLDANDIFVKMMGTNLRNRTFRQSFPGIEKDEFNWIEICGQVGKMGNETRFNQYFLPNDRWYDCILYPYFMDCFVFGIIDVTEKQSGSSRLPGTIPRCSNCKISLTKVIADEEYVMEWWECRNCGEMQVKQ